VGIPGTNVPIKAKPTQNQPIDIRIIFFIQNLLMSFLQRKVKKN